MATKQKKESFFWTSYSDLMTSMFFVMLVLFVLAIALLHHKVVEITKIKDATEAELDKIKQLEASISRIDTTYFEYNEEYKRHTLKDIQVSFRTGSSNINDISSEDLEKLEQAGKSIVRFMQSAQKNLPDAKYLLIIEGQSSKDYYARNYELSYERSLALVKYWVSKDILFDSLPCEVIISGSGQASSFRVEPDISGNEKNQRFVIHIIPKPGIFSN